MLFDDYLMCALYIRYTFLTRTANVVARFIKINLNDVFIDYLEILYEALVSVENEINSSVCSSVCNTIYKYSI